MNKKKDSDLSNFEDDLKSLQKILNDIDKDDLSLEMMIEKYQQGIELSKNVKKLLKRLNKK